MWGEVSDLLMIYVYSLIEIVDTFETYSQNYINCKESIHSVEKRLLYFDESYAIQSTSLNFVRNEIRDFKRDYEKYRDTTLKLDSQAIFRHDYLKDAKALSDDINRIAFGLEDLNSNMMTTDNYLDKYLPFRIQNFISETLENTIPKDQLVKLATFEKVKYKHMHENIIKDDGVPNLKKSYPDIKEIIDQGTDKSTKRLPSSKRIEAMGDLPTNLQTESQSKTSQSNHSRLHKKTTKLKDLLVMAKNTPYQYFKDIDSATIKKEDSSLLKNMHIQNSPITEMKSKNSI